MMNRRTLIRQALLITGGAILLPACSGPADKSPTWSNLAISADQEATIARFCEILLPKGKLPGAIDIATPQFVLRMINDCRSPEDQKAYETQLAAFEKWSAEKEGKSFSKLDDSAAKNLLLEMEAQRNSDTKSDELAFYRTTRGLAIQHYINSEAYLTQVTGYNIIPAKFQGCTAA